MRKLLTATATVAALTLSPLLFAGTANASVAPDTQASACAGYTLKLVNGRWTLVPTTSSGCTSSNTGTSGSSGGTGTSTPGTVVNNCYPVTSCSGSATGTAGRSR